MSRSDDEFEQRLRRVLDRAARQLPVRGVVWQRPPPARPKRGRLRLGNIATLLAAATAIAVAVLALVVLKHGSAGTLAQPGPLAHHGQAQPPTGHGPLLPTHPSRRQRQELHFLSKAMSTVARDDTACAHQPAPIPEAVVNPRPPSPALLAILGVLRRPAKPTDALPGMFARAPKSLPAKRIYTRYGRRARSRHGIGYYIAPIANANPLNIIPARCYAEQRLALRRALPTVPERLRVSVLELEPRFLDQQRYDRRPQPGVCLLSIDERGAGGISCHLTINAIKQGSTGNFQGEPSGGGVIYGVVPDGVATVTLYLPTRAVTGHVLGNVYIVRYPGRSLQGFAHKTIWRALNGTIIKIIHTP